MIEVILFIYENNLPISPMAWLLSKNGSDDKEEVVGGTSGGWGLPVSDNSTVIVQWDYAM